MLEIYEKIYIPRDHPIRQLGFIGLMAECGMRNSECGINGNDIGSKMNSAFRIQHSALFVAQTGRQSGIVVIRLKQHIEARPLILKSSALRFVLTNLYIAA